LTAPSILALDFDGVVCDGLREYFESAWRAYTLLWASPGAVAPAGLAERFYALSPVVESGWEMPLVIKALLAGVNDAAIAARWADLAPQLLDGREAADVGRGSIGCATTGSSPIAPAGSAGIVSTLG
jgi:hypothetical protein